MRARAFPNEDKARSKTDPATMSLHAYHPDLPAIRQSYARYADSVARMDRGIGQNIAWLKKTGQYEKHHHHLLLGPRRGDAPLQEVPV